MPLVMPALSVLRAFAWLLPHIVAFLLLAWLTLRLAANFRFLRDVRVQAEILMTRPASQWPRISVLVPARNEDATISTCITSLLCQQYPNVEILVFDDGSTDGTAWQLDALRGNAPTLTVIHGAGDPPPGWNGKSYACYRLAQHATGDWLLFTDADTLHLADSLRRGVAHALALDVTLLSAFPRQRTVTWSERVMVSFVLDFIPLVTLDLRAIWRGRSRQVIAIGQYVLVNASAYRAVGGHASIAGALIDDFALARHFRACGHRLALVDGTSLLTCRMYRALPEVWAGFSKNLMGAITMSSSLPTTDADTAIAARRRNWSLGRRFSAFITLIRTRLLAVLHGLLFAWCYALLFVVPWFNLITSDQKALASLELVWIMLLRATLGHFLRRPRTEWMATSLASWGVMALGMATLVRRWRGQRIVWKGRLYRS